MAVPPNPLYNVDPGNVTFSTILGAAVGINVVTGVFSARAAYAAQLGEWLDRRVKEGGKRESGRRR